MKGVYFGHYEDFEGITGVSVLIFPEGVVASCDVRGSAPGTREISLLEPIRLINKIHGISLAGGSAFGLSAASGVMRYLREKNIGFETPFGKVPIVSSAIIFDLGIGKRDAFPDEEMGYKACLSLSEEPHEGSFGAGTGATVGKILGMDRAMKSGVGFYSDKILGVEVAAFSVVNAFGDIYEDGKIIAGARKLIGKGFLNTEEYLKSFLGKLTISKIENTTLVVVITDAKIEKWEAKKISEMAHDGIARAIKPVHTMIDGDIVFTVSTCKGKEIDLTTLGTYAAKVTEKSIIRAVKVSKSLGGIPSYEDLKNSIQEDNQESS
ncbi:MAG: P1 family peptidase [Caldisericia bacterium]|jgi:L-aminopeptidase/D-esterase-like protein|nr:P1 family peptidase [Caldisericia bacterium]